MEEEEETDAPLMPRVCIAEMRSKDRERVVGLLSAEHLGIHQVIDIKKYSSLGRLLHVTTHVLRFIEKLRCPPNPSTVLSCAENLWIRAAQTLLIDNEKFPVWKSQFGLFLDSEGIWRCGGRISNADITYTVKHPIILSFDHTLTNLVV